MDREMEAIQKTATTLYTEIHKVLISMERVDREKLKRVTIGRGALPCVMLMRHESRMSPQALAILTALRVNAEIEPHQFVYLDEVELVSIFQHLWWGDEYQRKRACIDYGGRWYVWDSVRHERISYHKSKEAALEVCGQLEMDEWWV